MPLDAPTTPGGPPETSLAASWASFERSVLIRNAIPDEDRAEFREMFYSGAAAMLALLMAAPVDPAAAGEANLGALCREVAEFMDETRAAAARASPSLT